MTIDDMREGIAQSMSSECDELWYTVLEELNPAHYGVDDLSFEISIQAIFVRIQERTFDFKKGSLSFTARIGGSSEESGADHSANLTVDGEGKFEFDGSKIRVTGISVNHPLDLFPEARL